MTPSQPEAPSRRRWSWVVLAFVAGMVIMGAIAFLLTNIQTHKAEAIEYPLKTVKIADNELDPAVWGENFPREYDSFMKTEIDTIETPYGGSVPFNKLEKYPILKRVWAGYAFSVDYNKERGHYYALIDQKKTKRQEVVKQPGACANCHAAEAPQLIAQMGWEKFNITPYKEISGTLHLGSSCADCHDPETMELRITRPAFKNAMAEGGVDLSKATRQEMRTYVCAQCHVEYYFQGRQQAADLPLGQGAADRQHHRVLRRIRLQGLDAQGDRRADAEDAASGVRDVQHRHPRPLRRRLRRLPHALRPRGRGEGLGSLAAQPVGQRQQGVPDLPQAG